MDVRKRINEGKGIRVRPLAEAIGVAPSTIYRLIESKKVRAYDVGMSKIIPADEGARLLGMTEVAA